VESESDFEASLNYTYTRKFKASNELKSLGSNRDTLLFIFPKSDKIIKKVRLDFGNNPEIKPVIISQLQILFDDKTIVLDKDDVFNGFYNNSGSIDLDKGNQIIRFNKEVKPFDPYIIFSPLAELSTQNSVYTLTLVLPFSIFLLLFIVFNRKHFEIKILDLLILLFIICIPLKIAWTTFTTLLLCTYGLIYAVYKKKIQLNNPVFYFFITLFCLLTLFGRPSSYEAIGESLSLLLFAGISITIPLPKYKIFRYFAFFFLILNAIMLASGISFLLWFNDFYAQGITDYYADIKIYSGDIRKWLYYDHAAFLSFFGLIGTLFLYSLHKRKEIDIKLLYLYHVLLLLFIILMATRICLLIYLVFLLNMLLKWNTKKLLLLNATLFIVFATVLTLNIEKIDMDRSYLWSVSWQAIKEKPFFGHGLGQSNAVLHKPSYIDEFADTPSIDLNHSHNQFITYLLEIGIVGSLMILGVLIYFIYKTKLYRDKTVILFLFGLAYIFMTESMLKTSKPIYIICFLFLVLTTKYLANTKQDIVE